MLCTELCSLSVFGDGAVEEAIKVERSQSGGGQGASLIDCCPYNEEEAPSLLAHTEKAMGGHRKKTLSSSQAERSHWKPTWSFNFQAPEW